MIRRDITASTVPPVHRIAGPARRPLALLVAVPLIAVPLAASAELRLDPSRSSVTLLSTKVLADGSTSVTERHAFTELVGTVDDEGAASVGIPLASIETGVPIRNERMAEFLFETDTYPDATIEANVPADALESGSRQIELQATLDLHGQRNDFTTPVSVDRDGDAITVTAIEPVLLDAAAYDLDGGIGQLAELAKLLHIPTTVPVSFSLTFVESGG